MSRSLFAFVVGSCGVNEIQSERGRASDLGPSNSTNYLVLVEVSLVYSASLPTVWGVDRCRFKTRCVVFRVVHLPCGPSYLPCPCSVCPSEDASEFKKAFNPNLVNLVL
jgi:hypothetical protein